MSSGLTLAYDKIGAREWARPVVLLHRGGQACAGSLRPRRRPRHFARDACEYSSADTGRYLRTPRARRAIRTLLPPKFLARAPYRCPDATTSPPFLMRCPRRQRSIFKEKLNKAR